MSTTVAQQTVERAAEILHQANRTQTSAEKQQAAKIAAMMGDPNGKALTILLADQAFRSQRPARIADQIRHLLAVYGVPRYFAIWERAALLVGNVVGRVAPALVVPFITARLRQETNTVILPGEEAAFRAYLQKRQADGMRLNINQLGEAILGEGEAARRFAAYLALLQRPEVDYISVKISSIFSQINLVAYDETVAAIKEKLRALYRTAQQHGKFVNLDMEEYRDLHLTMDAFQQVLDEDEFLTYRAGIVLQAYLPDSFAAQKQLTDWALDRAKRGGATVKLRLVKGANLAMEQVEASSHGWEQAPYASKEEVDANYKRMVTYGSHPDRAKVVHLGIASHNLFDLAYALVLRDQHALHPYVDFEMLEGMANHQARALRDAADGVLLYAPVVKRADFHSAIAYLVRRLDENTAPENFLHDLFGLTVDSHAWNVQKDRFLRAYARMDTVSDQPARRQNRQTEALALRPDAPFGNIPDSDWALPANQAWIKTIRDRWYERMIDPIPLQIGGQFVMSETQGKGDDPSQPGRVAYHYALASVAQIDQALKVATESTWAQTSISARKQLLVACAEKLAAGRGALLGAMMLDGGKRAMEADPEVSEAIDFANYYARSLDDPAFDGCTLQPFGVVVVTPPWNFPLAIPCGGVLAALMAGNTVILKPAPEAVLVAWEFMNMLWAAGIPQDALQFLPTTDDEVGKGLITDPRVGAVILTGAYETGRMFKEWLPNLRLFAETSGKNAMIITAMADHDQAIKELVKSAFGHSGQKCSAASLAILEAEVYDNPAFRRQLRDAAASLKVGSAWELGSMVTPIIREPGTNLHRALTQLDAGESWLLEPRQINSHLWSPGIKLGVQRGSFFHKTECFGPVLGVMRAQNLQDAIAIANDNDFGLTGGLQSLDEREIDYWREHIEVGNAYINRGTTGAIVQRQPFGGWKKSVFGYAKAGGANYVPSLGQWIPKDEKLPPLAEIQRRYEQAWRTHYSQAHDLSGVLGESNIFRYRPIREMILRLEGGEHPDPIHMVALAAAVCGVPLTISAAPGAHLPDDLDGVTVAVEDDAALWGRVAAGKGYEKRLRVLQPAAAALHSAALAAHVMLIDAPPLPNGRLELRHYLHEQAVSQTIHRYGNIVPEYVP